MIMATILAAALCAKDAALCEAAVKMVPGSVVEIPANVECWHGAAPRSWFSHLAIECNPATNKNTWLEPVSDADYSEATK